MSEQSEERVIQQGHECAMSAMSAQRDRVASLSPGDRLHWWFGFLTAALGAARASLGEPAFRSLRAALAEGLYPSADAVRKQFIRIVTQWRKRGTYIKGEVPTKKKA
jgi:hypothetical protein